MKEKYELTVWQHPVDRDQYLKKVKSTIAEVVGFYLEQDKDLPIYLDALKRGQDILINKLRKGQFSLEDVAGFATRSYFYQDNQLHFKLRPKSTDPYERAIFYDAAKQNKFAVDGQSNIWTDPYLVNTILQEGLTRQSLSFNNFLKTYKYLLYVNQVTTPHSNYFSSSKQNYFKEVLDTYLSIKRRAKSEDDLRKLYTSEHVITNSPVLYEIPKAIQAANSILRLDRLFVVDGKTVSGHERVMFENTLAIELLTNPQAVKSQLTLTLPLTTTKQVSQVVEFINLIKQDLTLRQFEQELYIIIDHLIEEIKPDLKGHFTKLGISEEIGFEFLSRLLFKRFKNLAETDSFRLAKDVMTQPSLDYRPARTHGLSQNEQIILVTKCVQSLDFKMASFSKFSTLDKSTVLKKILTEAKSYKGGQNYQNVIRKLINAFGIKYLPDTEKLGMKLSDPDEKGATIFINLCFEQIKQADSIIIETFDKLLVSASLKDYIKKYKIPSKRINYAVPQRKYTLFSTIDILNNQIVFNVSTAKINYPILIEATAGYSLVAYYLEENIQNLTLKEIIDVNTNHSLLYRTTILVNPKNYQEFNLKVTQKALQILEDFKKTNFPDQYWQNKDGFILKLVEQTSS